MDQLLAFKDIAMQFLEIFMNIILKKNEKYKCM